MKTKIIFLFSCFTVILKLKADLLVQISQGIINGTTQESRNGKSFSAFLGIPYGKPPVGNLRFRSPVPAEKWDGVRQADTFGNMCYQTIFGIFTYGQEDCLFLNVYTPVRSFEKPLKLNTRNTLLPVMVFIHGGAFILGSGDTYGANYFLDKDIILVSINYRLGIFGFLTSGDLEAPGNFGLKDQLLALKWVQKNIKVFGGDPNRVTISGQSAGGVSVHYHALSKASNGLFHQYIMQSGSALCPWAFHENRKLFRIVKKVAELVLCPSFSTKHLVDCLRKKSSKTLLFASNLVGAVQGIDQFTWVPTNEPDAKDAFLTDNPNNLMDQMKDLPFISGVVKHEGQLFTFPFYVIGLLNLFTETLGNLMLHFTDFKAKPKKNFARKLKKFYLTDHSDLPKSRQILDGYTNILSDGLFIYPEVRMLEKVTKKMKNPNYLYSFGYRSSVSILPNVLKDNAGFGVAHVDELLSFYPIYYGPVNTSNIIFSPTNIKISELMVDLWTSFATNGFPSSSKLNVKWKPYNTFNNTHLQIGNLKNNSDPEVTLSNDFYTDRMNFWKENTIL